MLELGLCHLRLVLLKWGCKPLAMLYKCWLPSLCYHWILMAA